jgi:ribosomal protein S17E
VTRVKRLRNRSWGYIKHYYRTLEYIKLVHH